MAVITSKGLRIGYTINIRGVVIDSNIKGQDDLISLMNTTDAGQTDHALDLIIGNKDQKYTNQFIIGDPVNVQVRIEDKNGGVLYQKDLFSGPISVVNWDYMTMHLVAGGCETMFNLEAPATRRTYPNRVSVSDYLEIVEDLRKDYNEAVPTSPIEAVFPVGNLKANPESVFEVADGETIETVMDHIDIHLGATHFILTMEGKSYLIISDGRTPAAPPEIIDYELGASLIYDSAAKNEIGYITEVIVHGTVNQVDQDDRHLPGTKTCWGKAYVDDPMKKVRHIDVTDLACCGEDACKTRAEQIFKYGIAAKDNIKPVFVNVAPELGAEVSYDDPLFPDIHIEGIVQRREIRISANEGWICTLELAQAMGTGIEPTLTSGTD